MFTDATVSVDLKKAILQGRTAKKMTQAQVAQVCYTLPLGQFSRSFYMSVDVRIFPDSGKCSGNQPVGPNLLLVFASLPLNLFLHFVIKSLIVQFAHIETL